MFKKLFVSIAAIALMSTAVVPASAFSWGVALGGATVQGESGSNTHQNGFANSFGFGGGQAGASTYGSAAGFGEAVGGYATPGASTMPNGFSTSAGAQTSSNSTGYANSTGNGASAFHTGGQSGASGWAQFSGAGGFLSLP